MGKLGTCPTCDGRLSTNASRCPHCGETSLDDDRSYVLLRIEACSACGGSGTKDYVSPNSGWNCLACEGAGQFGVSQLTVTSVVTGERLFTEEVRHPYWKKD